MITRNTLDPAKFNPTLALPFELRQQDFRATVQDVYDFFFDVNTGLTAKGLERQGVGVWDRKDHTEPQLRQ